MNTIQERTTVIKVGTDVITQENGQLDEARMAHIIDQIVRVREKVGRVILVTSGAVAAGRSLYGVQKSPDEDIVDKQVFASAGQPELMHRYNKLLAKHGWVGNQVLLTADDFQNRMFHENRALQKFLGTLNRIAQKTKRGLPIVNHNDVTSDAELAVRCTKEGSSIGDNDDLALQICTLTKAERLIILTSVDGVLRHMDDPESTLREIGPNDESWLDCIVTEQSKNGTGGMYSKCNRAQYAASQGCTAHIVNGRTDNSISRIIAGDTIGTTFLTQ